MAAVGTPDTFEVDASGVPPGLQAHVDAWLAGEIAPRLDLLAAYARMPGAELMSDDIEDVLRDQIDVAIGVAEAEAAGAQPLSAKARALHGLAEPPPVAKHLRGMSVRALHATQDRVQCDWWAAERAADYRADKQAELDGAPNAATAVDAVARWNVLGDKYRVTGELPPAEPAASLPGASKAELHAAVLSRIVSFFTRSDSKGPPPRMLLTAETGSRKTGIALSHLHTAIEARKAAKLPHRAVLPVPDHRLGREIEERARAAGINAVVFLGRGDPNKPDQPCRNPEAVTLARQAGADIRATVCGPSPAGRCGFRDNCAYFAGLERAKAADLVIVAHNFLFEPLPKVMLHNLAWVIIDEDFTPGADRVFDLTLDTLASESLDRAPVLDAETAEADTAELNRLHGMVIEASRACIDGYLTADALRTAGFTAMSDAPARMRALNWRRKQPVQMQPGMDMEARKAAARLASVNGQLRGIAGLTYALEAILTRGQPAAGLVSVRLDMRRSGSQTVLTVRGQREPAAWLADLPVLALNATGRIEDMRRVFPDAELAEAPRAAWPHVEVHQITGGFGRSTLARHLSRLAELRDFIILTTLGSQSALVVTHKSCEDTFIGMPGIATAHHGAIVGSDQHGGVNAAFIIGGTFASNEDIASIAAARGGGVVIAAKPERVARPSLLTDGTAVEIECMAYADQAVDAVHRGLYDTSIVQAVGRVRPLERNAHNPAVVYVFGNVALPFPVATAAHWRDKRPDRLARMVAHDAVWLSAEDMHGFEEPMFRSVKAAEHVRGRIEDAREATRAITRHDTRAWVQIRYQLRGQGMKLREVLTPKGAEIATRAAMEAKHGELAQFHVRPFTPGREVVPDLGKLDNYREIGSTSRRMPADLAELVRKTVPLAAASPLQAHIGPPDG